MPEHTGGDGSCLPLNMGFKEKEEYDEFARKLYPYVASFYCGITENGPYVLTHPAVEREMTRAVKHWSEVFYDINPEEFKVRALEIVWETLCNHEARQDLKACGGAFIMHIRKTLNQLEDVALDATQSRKSYHHGKTYYHPKWTQRNLKRLYDKLTDPTNLYDDPELIYIEKEKQLEKARLVQAAMTHLNKLHQNTIDIYMQYGETLSQAQMADNIGISLDAFESRLRRAKACLRKTLEKKYQPVVKIPP